MSDDIVKRLREACDGHPYAKIEWPHRILHEAADEIERLTTELKEATEIIKLQLRGKDSVLAFAFVDKHSEG